MLLSWLVLAAAMGRQLGTDFVGSAGSENGRVYGLFGPLCSSGAETFKHRLHKASV